MIKNFAVFILSYGRPKNIKTLKSDFTESLNFLESNLHTDKKREQSNINKHKQSSLKKPMLNQINKHNKTNFIMSYSYGRALQQSALKFWAKDIRNIEGTQKVFDHRAKMNTLAAQGKWSKDLEI